MDSKIELRLKAKALRKTLDLDNLSQDLINKIRELNEYKDSNHILLFYPMRYEVNLLGLLNDKKSFYLPRVNGKNIEICPYKIGDKLMKSTFNVYEPINFPVDESILDLAIIPALMVDNFGYRLGYGGGFYDRFLENNLKLTTVVPISKDLVVEKLPIENFDKKVDIIIKG